jgi:hypothetical protein
MSEEYIWDRSGEPDRELAHLEETLGALRGSNRRRGAIAHESKRRGLVWRWTVAAAAALIIVIAGAVIVQKTMRMRHASDWQLSFHGAEPSRVRIGQVIDTPVSTGAMIESPFVGKVDIEPASQLQLLATSADQQRVALDHGTIHALIWAPPTRFVVDTPSAKTVDLGCEYTLRVAKDGLGFLTVEVGWVAFQWHNIESFIPAGAACVTRPGHGPDIPYFLDASSDLKKALVQFDLSGSPQALDAALAAARPHDGLSLWHLLQRTQGQQRAQVFDRFATLVRLPQGVTRNDMLRGDSNAMDAAWDALQLGDTTWWREWKRKW